MIPPAAITDWERSEGWGETICTWIPASASFTAQHMPEMPPPIMIAFFISSPSSLQKHDDLHLQNSIDRHDIDHRADHIDDPVQFLLRLSGLEDPKRDQTFR